jgi:hypothetical protein
MMTYADIFMDYIRHIGAHPEQRRGQVLFNYLYANPQTRSFANEICGTELDPFHNDKVIGDVLATLAIKMVTEESA